MDMKVYIDGQETNYMEEWLAKIDSLKALKLYYLANELPPRDYNMNFKNNNGVIVDEFQKDNQKYKSDWQCSYCQFSDLCWKEEKEKMLHHKFFINGVFS